MRYPHHAPLHNIGRCGFICKSHCVNIHLSPIFYGLCVTLGLMVYQETAHSHHSDITVIPKTSEEGRCSQYATECTPLESLFSQWTGKRTSWE